MLERLLKGLRELSCEFALSAEEGECESLGGSWADSRQTPERRDQFRDPGGDDLHHAMAGWGSGDTASRVQVIRMEIILEALSSPRMPMESALGRMQGPFPDHGTTF